MKSVCCCLLVAALTAGCLPETLPFMVQPPIQPAQPAETAVSPANPKPTRPVSLVTAEQVNETNAREKAQALWDELDREAQGERLPEAGMPSPPAKP